MCGIAGYLGKFTLPPDNVAQTLKALEHRGPDGQGIFTTETSSGHHLVLIHTRLAILDLDPRANQPMKFKNGILCFNGEIYNYQENRDMLKSKHGVDFLTTSDTEVLLKMLVELGIGKTLQYIEGMWAFAFFDSEKDMLFLSRDRFAEKPLYYIETEDGVYFASELRALFTLMGKCPKINYQKLITYLFLGYRAQHKDETTYFNDVKLLDGNSTLHLYAGKIIKKEKFWDFSQKNLPSFKTIAKATEKIHEDLLTAVKLRLRSDVPIAFCMSGGIDSLSLISIAKKIFNYEVCGFTIRNNDERYDESTLVDAAVIDLGIQHHYVYSSTNNFFETLKTMIKNRMTPVSTISYYIHFLLMSKIKEQGYKVSISGTGADEFFTGYYDHYLFHIATLKEKQRKQAMLDWKNFVKPNIRNPLYQDPLLFVKKPELRDHLHQDYSMYREGGEKIIFHEEKFHPNLLRNRMLNELFKEVVPVILLEDDYNAMHCSIENRSPFLDSELLKSSSRIPNNFLIKEGYTKYILREAMKGVLPEFIRLNRKKVGFNASLFELLPTDFFNEIDYYLDASSKIFEFVDRKKIIDLFNNKNSSEKFLFNFLCAKIFLDLYSH